MFSFGRRQQAQASRQTQTSSQSQASRQLQSLRRPPGPPALSDLSTPAVPDSLWFASDFLLGAGMVILQPATDKIVVVYDSASRTWFLPKGRKDVGESTEQAALREAYEESGYRARFLPLVSYSRAPAPGSRFNEEATTEPIFLSTQYFRPRYENDYGGEYLTFWYVGEISENAVREEHTGMEDEQHYVSYLLSPAEALQRLGRTSVQGKIVEVAWILFNQTYRQRPDATQTEEPPQRTQRSSRSSMQRASRASVGSA